MWIRRLLGALLAFGALNAYAGGYYGLSGAAGVPREWLAGSPFTDYVLPGAILFVVVGGALALAATMVFSRHRRARRGACAAAVVLLVWIAVQVALIGYVSWMQPATFAAGVLILVLTSLLPSTTPETALAPDAPTRSADHDAEGASVSISSLPCSQPSPRGPSASGGLTR